MAHTGGRGTLNGLAGYAMPELGEEYTLSRNCDVSQVGHCA